MLCSNNKNGLTLGKNFKIKKIKTGNESITVEKSGSLHEANKAHLKKDASVKNCREVWNYTRLYK